MLLNLSTFIHNIVDKCIEKEIYCIFPNIIIIIYKIQFISQLINNINKKIKYSPHNTK